MLSWNWDFQTRELEKNHNEAGRILVSELTINWIGLRQRFVAFILDKVFWSNVAVIKDAAGYPHRSEEQKGRRNHKARSLLLGYAALRFNWSANISKCTIWELTERVHHLTPTAHQQTHTGNYWEYIMFMLEVTEQPGVPIWQPCLKHIWCLISN